MTDSGTSAYVCHVTEFDSGYSALYLLHLFWINFAFKLSNS